MVVVELETLADYEEKKKVGKVAIDFTASWCGPCKSIGPKFVAMDDDFPGITFYKLDVDKNSDGSAAAGISAMPTFKFYLNGEEVITELVGASEQKLREKLTQLANK